MSLGEKGEGSAFVLGMLVRLLKRFHGLRHRHHLHRRIRLAGDGVISAISTLSAVEDTRTGFGGTRQTTHGIVNIIAIILFAFRKRADRVAGPSKPFSL